MSLAAFRGVGAIRQPVGRGARLVLYALADHHNALTGVCCPGQAKIAEHSQIARRSVQRCIDELVEGLFIKVVPGGGVGSGDRKTDAYVFLFPLPSLKDEPATVRPPTGDSVSAMGDVESHKSGTNQEDKPQDAREALSNDEEPVDYEQAVSVIWQGVGEMGRKRSSKADVETNLRSAIKRRPKGVTEEGHLRRILLGLRGYLASADARKDDGAFERGAHVMLAKDRWATFVEDAEARLDRGDVPLALAGPAVADDGAPSEDLQRLWAELAAQGMPWNEERGPRPGRPGCRISAPIQVEFGFTPWPVDVLPAFTPLTLPPPGLSGTNPTVAIVDDLDDDRSAFM